MPLPRRRSSFLGQPSSPSAPTANAAANAAAGRMGFAAGGTTAPRGVFVGSAPHMGVASSGLGTRVSRRALGISSVFLQGMRSSAVAVVPRAGERAHAGASQGLNGCLMEYRDKVRALELLNQQLEEQIRLGLDRKASSAGSWGALRRDWEDVYRQVSEAFLDNARLMLQTENVQASAEDFKDRYDNEQPFRKAVEEEISSLYKVMEDARETQADLEQQMENMRAEIQDLEQNHEEDVRVLYHQMAGLDVDESEAPIQTNLDQILAYIRSHWEKVIERNRAETDNYLEYKQEGGLGGKMSRGQEEMEGLKTQCSESGCKIQSLQAETESIRALKRGLENSLSDARHWHDIELQNLGSVVGKLEAELSEVRGDIDQQRRDYDTLMSNKTRLEQEIGAYHGILDWEERRYQPCHATTSATPCETKGATKTTQISNASPAQ
ncbi:phakinin-like isoform X1 [Gadus chalcogrammus]|uniref:phakinin-like n=2 Tax=Gadus chalcogrammus TaxID=1042646 RepID=UPI0024C4AFF1|nr:phakinin-like [Gadus chalcogrammus]XP_056453140.1 phakinin-like isoform X1 [Gadus chalcogrammus]